MSYCSPDRKRKNRKDRDCHRNVPWYPELSFLPTPSQITIEHKRIYCLSYIQRWSYSHGNSCQLDCIQGAVIEMEQAQHHIDYPCNTPSQSLMLRRRTGIHISLLKSAREVSSLSFQSISGPPINSYPELPSHSEYIAAHVF